MKKILGLLAVLSILSCSINPDLSYVFRYSKDVGTIKLNDELIPPNYKNTYYSPTEIKLEAFPKKEDRVWFMSWTFIMEGLFPYFSHYTENPFITTITTDYNAIHANFESERNEPIGFVSVKSQTKIMFYSNYGGRRCLWMMDTDGKNKVLVYELFDSYNYLLISNSLFVFREKTLIKLDLETGATSDVLKFENKNSIPSSSCWAIDPSLNYLVYCIYVDADKDNLAVYDIKNKTQKILSLPASGCIKNIRFAESKIYFQIGYGDGIYLYDIQSNFLNIYLSLPEMLSFEISPDLKTILYQDNYTLQAHVIDLATKQIKKNISNLGHILSWYENDKLLVQSENSADIFNLLTDERTPIRSSLVFAQLKDSSIYFCIGNAKYTSGVIDIAKMNIGEEPINLTESW